MAALNSSAVKAFVWFPFLQRYSFSVFGIHRPFSSRGRRVRRMCAWGLRKTISFRSVTRFPSASTGMPEESLTGGLWILISAIMPFETKESWTNSCTRRMFSCRDNSWGSAPSISRASLQSRLFSASSTAFHRTARSFHSPGAFAGSMISLYSTQPFWV